MLDTLLATGGIQTVAGASLTGAAANSMLALAANKQEKIHAMLTVEVNQALEAMASAH